MKRVGCMKMVSLCERLPFSQEKGYTRKDVPGGKNKNSGFGEINKKDGLVHSSFSDEN